MRKVLITLSLCLGALSASAQSNKAIELADLVRVFMPGNEDVDWSLGSGDLRINWTTNGVNEVDVNGGVRSFREGEAVVTIEGKPLKVLRKRLESVKWKITLRSEFPKKFGPENVEINPDTKFDVDIIEYLKTKGFGAVRECEYKMDGSNYVRGYLVQKGGKKAYISETTSGGSGGFFNTFQIFWSKPMKLCE